MHSIEKAADRMKHAQRLMRLFRSNLEEGFHQHALLYLMEACVCAGQAHEHALAVRRSRTDLWTRIFIHARNRFIDATKLVGDPT